MRLLLCLAVFTTASFGVYGFPTEFSEPEVPRKGGNPNKKPVQNGLFDKPKPSFMPKPSSQGQSSENLQTSASHSPNSHVMDASQSVVSSELPSAEVYADPSSEILSGPAPVAHIPAEPAHDPILETASNFPAPEAVLQDAIPEPEAAVVTIQAETFSAAEVPVVQSDAQLVEAETFSAAEVPEVQADAQIVEAETFSAAEAPEVQDDAQIVADLDIPLDNSNVKVPLPSKPRRHAGVEHQTALRIGDFEDVESDSALLPFTYKAAPEYPANQEQFGLGQEISKISKEEMILLAMEQMHPNLPHMQLNGHVQRRPNNSRPNLMNSSPMKINSGSILANPQYSFQSNSFEDDDEGEDPSEDDQAVDLRNGESATIVQEQSSGPKTVQVPKGSASVSDSSNLSPSNPYGSGPRNKPRPYGMDRPSKNRPTLDSGMKDKNEHFGLPHSSSNDYMHKGEAGVSSDSGTTSYLGFQIPSIKWTSFTDLFPTLWGSRNRDNSLGKSDETLEQTDSCVDDQDASASEGVRSPVIQGNILCASSGKVSSCNDTCVSSGFGSGSCLGPYPTPGCLCRHPFPHAKEFGLILRPLKEESSDSEVSPVQDLEPSASPVCKKCACIESCRNIGSYTGFCSDRCYCAVPWYNKEV